MLSEPKKQNALENFAKQAGLNSEEIEILSLFVVKNVIAGIVEGVTDDEDHEHELVQGVTYIVVGLGAVESALPDGITDIL
jgi:hypothetical protein